MHNVKGKTLRWTFIKSLEPPRVVQIRTQEMLTKTNLFAQITVRFNTQQVRTARVQCCRISTLCSFPLQTLAVYDRFGRLIHGSKTSARDVLEYVVFERHLANVYGTWRLHAKIIPDWMEAKPEGYLTHWIKPPKVKEDESAEEDKEDVARKTTSSEEVDEGEESKITDRFGRVIPQESKS